MSEFFLNCFYGYTFALAIVMSIKLTFQGLSEEYGIESPERALGMLEYQQKLQDENDRWLVEQSRKFKGLL